MVVKEDYWVGTPKDMRFFEAGPVRKKALDPALHATHQTYLYPTCDRKTGFSVQHEKWQPFAHWAWHNLCTCPKC